MVSHLHSILQRSNLCLQAGDVLLVSRAEPGRILQEGGTAGARPHPTASPEAAAGSFTGSYHLPGTGTNLL